MRIRRAVCAGRGGFRLGTVALATAGGLAVAVAVGGRAEAQVGLSDPRFEEVRRASVTWDNRPGPPRKVVDVVCLVPDVPTFLEAVGTWDAGHFFPILLEDGEYALKFLRAFRPSRIVRFPSKARPTPPEQRWERAVAAVGRSWSADDTPADKVAKGDARPTDLGPLPPGVVVASPDGPALAGAVALASGRFQPLVKWSPAKRFGDVLTVAEAQELALDLEGRVAASAHAYDALGDDCDFVTLAGDYPYAYLLNGQPNAVDDLVLRSARTGKRWAFAGRLVGDPVSSVYRAMCSLFLHPSSALLANTYDQQEPPWTEYRMSAAAQTLRPVVAVTERAGGAAGLAGWHRLFDPVNPFGLIVLNTHGSPHTFHLDGGPGQTADVPETGPTAVLMVHSFSAAAPLDPDTIAGRWLANGAFAFYGSMNEPFLQAFRTPTLAASFLAANLPVVVAERKLAGEVHAQPWRLVYFGDPLYRIKSPAADAGRLGTWGPLDDWPVYVEFERPVADAPEDLRLNWAVKMAVHNLQAGAVEVDVGSALLGIARDRIDPAYRPLYDDVLVDALIHAGRRAELIDRLSQLAPGARSPAVRRHLETAQAAALQRAAADKDVGGAWALWDGVVRARGSSGFVATFTERVGRLSLAAGRAADWRARLHDAARAAAPENVAVIEAEATRVEGAARPAGGRR